MPITLLHDDTHRVTALLHAKRIRMDEALRGECEWLFSNPTARKAYYGRKGLRIDEVGEALWDARLVAERPTTAEVIDLLEQLFRPAAPRASSCNRVEAARVLGVYVEEIDRKLETRRKNRWRLFECLCPRPKKVRYAGDELPVRCEECGERFELRTVKLDLSNVMMPSTVDDVVPF